MNDGNEAILTPPETVATASAGTDPVVATSAFLAEEAEADRREAERLLNLEVPAKTGEPAVVAPAVVVKPVTAAGDPEPLAAMQEDPVAEDFETVEMNSVSAVTSRRYVETFPWSHDLPNAPPEHEVIGALLPRTSNERFVELMQRVRNDEVIRRHATTRWATGLAESTQSYAPNRQWSRAVNRSTGLFTQLVPDGGRGMALRRGVGLAGADKDGAKYEGGKAVHYLRDIAGVSGQINVPLFGSGFWMVLRKPQEPALLDLFREIQEAKVSLGRQSGGLAFSNRKVYVSASMVQFALDHVVDTSITDLVVTDANAYKYELSKLISCVDIPVILAALAGLVYSNGFNYQTQCTASPESCQHIAEQRCDITKMVWWDQSCLTDYQIKHMTKSRGKVHPVALVKAYQECFADVPSSKIDIKGQATIHLKVPSVAEYATAGQVWIDEIVTMVTTALGMDIEDNIRSNYVEHQSRTSILREFQHYVDVIESNNGKAVVSDEESIAAMLTTYSTMDDVRDEIVKKIGEFIDDTCVGIVATTDYVCPNCKKLQNKTGTPMSSLRTNSELIPINPEYVFFVLLAWKDQQVRARKTFT